MGFVLNEIGDRAGDLAVVLVLAHLAGGFVAAALVLLACGVAVGGLLVAVWGRRDRRRAPGVDARAAGEREGPGTWLPGFGGLLDRIDSLLIAVPLAVLLG